MRKSVWSLPFDASTDFVTRRELAAGDVSLAPGDTVPETMFSPRRLRQLFDARKIVHRVTYEALMSGVSRFDSDPFAGTVTSEEPPVPEVPEPEVPAPVVPEVPGLPGTETPNEVPGLPGTEQPVAETPAENGQST